MKKSAATANDGGEGIDRAFRCMHDDVPMVRLDSEPRVSFATWDGERIDLDQELAVFRRERFTKYVKGIMAASLAICAIALVRAAVGGPTGSADASAPMAAAVSLPSVTTPATAPASESLAASVSTSIATKEAQIQTAVREIHAVSKRTQAAMVKYQRQQAAKASLAQRTRAFW
jgi:hypothetical protein